MLLDAMSSAIDMRTDSFKSGARSEEHSDGRERTGERGARNGGTSSRSLDVAVGVSVPSAVPYRWTKPYLDCETAVWEGQLVLVTGACRYFV